MNKKTQKSLVIFNTSSIKVIFIIKNQENNMLKMILHNYLLMKATDSKATELENKLNLKILNLFLIKVGYHKMITHVRKPHYLSISTGNLRYSVHSASKRISALKLFNSEKRFSCLHIRYYLKL